MSDLPHYQRTKAVDSQLNTPLECGFNVEAVKTPLAGIVQDCPQGRTSGEKEETRRKSLDSCITRKLGQVNKVTNGYPEEEG